MLSEASICLYLFSICLSFSFGKLFSSASFRSFSCRYLDEMNSWVDLQKIIFIIFNNCGVGIGCFHQNNCLLSIMFTYFFPVEQLYRGQEYRWRVCLHPWASTCFWTNPDTGDKIFCQQNYKLIISLKWVWTKLIDKSWLNSENTHSVCRN